MNQTTYFFSESVDVSNFTALPFPATLINDLSQGRWKRLTIYNHHGNSYDLAIGGEPLDVSNFIVIQTGERITFEAIHLKNLYCYLIDNGTPLINPNKVSIFGER